MEREFAIMSAISEARTSLALPPLESGLSTREHAAFVERLAQAGV